MQTACIVVASGLPRATHPVDQLGLRQHDEEVAELAVGHHPVVPGVQRPAQQGTLKGLPGLPGSSPPLRSHVKKDSIYKSKDPLAWSAPETSMYAGGGWCALDHGVCVVVGCRQPELREGTCTDEWECQDPILPHVHHPLSTSSMQVEKVQKFSKRTALVLPNSVTKASGGPQRTFDVLELQLAGWVDLHGGERPQHLRLALVHIRLEVLPPGASQGAHEVRPSIAPVSRAASPRHPCLRRA